jgi:XTP/dITP diphosphohydrolase/tetrapyrrole methylase family protein/MazG family protein
MARLRGPDGCPWDREQTHQTLRVPLIDETCELLDTIDRNDMEHMCEELGDVLLQVVFHAQLADERGDFNFDDVANGINEKLIRRHPHVFGDIRLEDSAEVLKQWEAIKASEKKNGPEASGLFKRLPPALPALMWASKVSAQIEKKGLQQPEVEEEADSLAEDLSAEEAGSMLYAMARACQQAGIDPETALREHTRRLMREIEEGQHSHA